MNSLTSRFHSEVFHSYLELLKAQYRFHSRFAHAKGKWEEQLTFGQLVNGPYLEKSQVYAAGATLESLPLHPSTVETIRRRLGGRGLYRHQTEAIGMVLTGENVVVATGTSSGKTLCYQIPILDDLLRDSSPGLRAIIIYPLNALVNDQLDEWGQMLGAHGRITFARFTGQTPNTQKDYVESLKRIKRADLRDRQFSEHELQREVSRLVAEHLERDLPNRLNHREATRANPPHVLVTNFSMLEYLLERPVDAPIFENARLKFLVLDEAHAYRGVQATEIAFLVRRLKDRLGVGDLTCIATSATLGRKDDPASEERVRRFATELFGGEFHEPNPVYGTPAELTLVQPSARPSPGQYVEAAGLLRRDADADARPILYPRLAPHALASLLNHDENLYRLRREILTRPTLLSRAAEQLWPDDAQAEEGLQALLEVVAAMSEGVATEQILPARLHYFIRTQDGLHVCLHKQCPARRDGQPSFFVSRKADADTPAGDCPHCRGANRKSKLVEVVSCRKCGYLFGALQDLGPRRARTPESADESGEGNGASKPAFDSFSTELGWAADSFWSYLSVEDELPYPPQPKDAEEEDEGKDLLLNPAKLMWCVVCGKKRDDGAGDNCACDNPQLREIKIFHRQCPHAGRARDYQNLYSQNKKPLASCPNCGARNASGLEPLRRFQESDDETGLAMAIPLSHFQISPAKDGDRLPRKLLCFTDHRQRAAAFPSLLEEETFAHDMGRKIVGIVAGESQPLDLISLGERLADAADQHSATYDRDFFLPVSRFPDEELDAKAKRNLWVAETFSYFGIPDSARESAEDLGLVAVEYQLKEEETSRFRQLLDATKFSREEAFAALQTLLAFMRQRKAFTLPKSRVSYDDPAFGRVTAEIFFALKRDGSKSTGWLPRVNKDGSYQDSYVTDYLRRLTGLAPAEVFALGEKVWNFLTSAFILVEGRGNRADSWQLDHERLFVAQPPQRFVCDRCHIVTAYAARQRCPRKGCEGTLRPQPFDPAQANIVERWVSGERRFTSLKSEEHTAQINKEVAKRIEDEFRAEGVNLLSSTTTFEMGINIGDLQKVLLRNAPPSSASYVQRVGRAGRGQDKNAVCVTLCRRTKYDADAWADPPRLMSGEVRTPTVFTANGVIARRHFNAAAFAKFLRAKVADERTLGGEVAQQTPLAPFLSAAAREGVPPDWVKLRPASLHLDFMDWLAGQSEADIFRTDAGRSLSQASGGFDAAVEKTREKYGEVVSQVAGELENLLKERRKRFNEGGSTSDLEQAVKNMLTSDVIGVLAKRGFLPRYAFPLDVVTLETGWTRWSREADVALSRDRGIAIAEFAPDAQVIAHKKVFTSAGLYVVSSTDAPRRRYYSKCPDCEQIRTGDSKESLLASCEVCGRSISAQYVKPFVEPAAFSIRLDKKKDGAARHRRSTLVRQRQTLTHFIDSVDEDGFTDAGLFRLALKKGGKLFRYNLGPRQKGFMLCWKCGASALMSNDSVGQRHKRLRAFAGDATCSNENPWKRIAYGHEFESFCLVVRPVMIPASVESLAYALQRGMCEALEIEPADVGVSWRWRGKKGETSNGVEIVLYDTAPGGAGFVQQASDAWSRVVEAARRICAGCNCEDACYDCLKGYGNQSHHEKLNRHLAAGFLNP